MKHWLVIQPLILSAICLGACDATKVATECVGADLIGQCPVGSNPVLGAVAESSCGGSFDANVVTESGSATGQCNSNGSCQFLCQFEVPCSCGVATLTKDAIVCAECPDQSCGDGRCEGTERAACEPNQEGCFACIEDCAGPTCGDGDCTGDEDPTICPQDCAAKCTPNASVCIGATVSKCAADGQTSVEFDCDTVGQACSGGECVAKDVCGNGICDGDEDTDSCAQDCNTVCNPSSRQCNGMTLVVCSADGQSSQTTDCAAIGEVCANGQCRPSGVCGNGVCEAGEEDCAQDCAAVCGNRVCENQEEVTCPEDCTTCGDGACGEGEIESCPQDCGICVPSEKTCIATTLRVCNANGTAIEEFDCDELFGLVCARGDCVEPGVCGNGACEAGSGESQATCIEDCIEVCGNGDCAGIESFQTCAVDCDPVCGDGACEGDEDYALCSFDCLESCGDGDCSGPEDRVNCGRDCGSCGDGECQDGFESASLNPPGALESCVVDCVVSQCREDADCDDDVACTANQCLNGSCIYAPDDDLCAGPGGDQSFKCIRLNGCCPDADGDGYADEACGGSDCNDDDEDVHPGALEVCGGGDMNCNGQHQPALLPAKKLTSSASAKRYMVAMDTGESLVLGWTGKPATYKYLELLEIGWDLLPEGPISTVEEVEVNEVTDNIAMAWNPGREQIGIWWNEAEHAGVNAYGPYWDSHASWITKDGTLIGDVQTIEAKPSGVGPVGILVGYGALALGDTVLITVDNFYYNGGYPNRPGGHQSGGVWELSATGNATVRWGSQASHQDRTASLRPVLLGNIITGLEVQVPEAVDPPVRGDLVNFDTTRTDDATKVSLDHASRQGDCALGSDGELLAIACGHQSKLYYHRATQGGGAFFTEQVLTGDYTPIAVGTSKLAPGKALQVGVVLRDAGNNMWFFVRDQAGEEVLAPAVIAGGESITSAWVMHDGNDFVVLWLAKTGGFEQAYGQRVTCE